MEPGQTSVTLAAPDRLCHETAQLVQVLSSKRLPEGKGPTDAMKIYTGGLEIMGHADYSLGADNVCIRIVGLVF